MPHLAALVLVLSAQVGKGAWVPVSESVTRDLQPKWPGLTAGIACDAAGEVYLAVSGLGLWKSADRATTWS
jgi:hypothetical protein